MAAGTELNHPVNAIGVLDSVSVLDVACMTPPPLDTLRNGNEKGIAVDDNGCSCDQKNEDRVVGEGSACPLADFARECMITTPIYGASTSAATTGRDPPVSEPKQSSKMDYKPIIRSGSWSDIGARFDMEDEHVLIDDLVGHLGSLAIGDATGAYYGVFDGHGGKEAAKFVKEKLLKFVVEDGAFPAAVGEAVRRAFLQTDIAFAEAYSMDQSGTTATTVFIFGRTLLVANAGDCRAVLCKRGKALEMSRDHKPDCDFERNRIEALGGFVDDGYLNGELSVSRAIGDWHMKDLKGIDGLLSAEPELQQVILTDEDEFLIIGSDGLWDVFTSQNAMDFARKKLQQHNDPNLCSRELVTEALRRDSRDNLTVVTVCFQLDPPPNLSSTFQVRRRIFVEALHSLQNLLDSDP